MVAISTGGRYGDGRGVRESPYLTHDTFLRGFRRARRDVGLVNAPFGRHVQTGASIAWPQARRNPICRSLAWPIDERRRNRAILHHSTISAEFVRGEGRGSTKTHLTPMPSLILLVLLAIAVTLYSTFVVKPGNPLRCASYVGGRA